MSERVLLTGISGYLASHIALHLLKAGYQVRGSLRSLARADKVRETLAQAGADTTQLKFVALDLLSDAGWEEAARDCRYVLHTASPLALRMPKNPMDLIAPAVAGTERALGAANAAGVERIVLTSSMAAIAYGHLAPHSTQYGAADWTNLEASGVNAYQQSKTQAERRAWAIMDQAVRRNALVTINPAVIFGPVLGDDPGTSASLVQRLLRGALPGLPRLSVTAIDVRDVAAAHIAAMTAPDSGGQRFPMGEESIALRAIARLLREHYPDRPVPRLYLPDWLIRLYGLFDSDVGSITMDLGQTKSLDSSAAIALLGRPLIRLDTAIIDTAASLIARDLV